jgi:hypothetical protein
MLKILMGSWLNNAQHCQKQQITSSYLIMKLQMLIVIMGPWLNNAQHCQNNKLHLHIL